MSKRIVISLGGNSIIKQNQQGTVTEQFANTRASLGGVVELTRRGYRVLITHGNGPQVGNILIRVEEALDQAYDVPLGVCVAQSQGEMGYMIQQSLQNAFYRHNIRRPVVTLITQTLVDRNDPSLHNPTKPIGPFYTQEQAKKLIERGLTVIEDAGRGYRRVVPSPMPRDIVEKELIKRLFEEEVVLIVAGGGGMPVYREPDGRFEGVDAVVDKDLATAILAQAIGASSILCATGVEKLKLNFRTPAERDLDQLTVSQAEQYLSVGQFPAGSMGPKIESAVQFLKKGGQEFVITLPEKMVEAFDGQTGTRIVPDKP
ncbi:MAG: carbamate kinase [Acidobacteria bacterium]|nr:carbamate kinase [Acidobacteriota bacterium]MBI3656907.1 carbamate kinase [Acidobacteriota bacterium]